MHEIAQVPGQREPGPSLSHLLDVDDRGDDVCVDTVDVVGQDAVPEVVPDAVARR